MTDNNNNSFVNDILILPNDYINNEKENNNLLKENRKFTEKEKELLLYYKFRSGIYEYCLKRMEKRKQIIKSIFFYPSIVFGSIITVLNALDNNNNVNIKYVNISLGIASAMCISIPEKLNLTQSITTFQDLYKEFRMIIMEIETSLIDGEKKNKDFVKNISIKFNNLILKTPNIDDKLLEEAEQYKKKK